MMFDLNESLLVCIKVDFVVLAVLFGDEDV